MKFHYRDQRIIMSMWAHGTTADALAWGFGVALKTIEDVIKDLLPVWCRWMESRRFGGVVGWYDWEVGQ